MFPVLEEAGPFSAIFVGLQDRLCDTFRAALGFSFCGRRGGFFFRRFWCFCLVGVKADLLCLLCVGHGFVIAGVLGFDGDVRVGGVLPDAFEGLAHACDFYILGFAFSFA